MKKALKSFLECLETTLIWIGAIVLIIIGIVSLLAAFIIMGVIIIPVSIFSFLGISVYSLFTGKNIFDKELHK